MQRYQVFVNDHLILLTESNKNNHFGDEYNGLEFSSLFNIEQASSNEAILMVEELLKEQSESIQVNIFSKDVEALWKEFKGHFKIIEAAGGFVVNEKEELLMIYRLEKWDLPKGKIEEGEHIEQAALREVEEECAVQQLKILDQLESTYHIYEHKGQLILKRTYWFHMYTTDNTPLIPQLEEDIIKAEWKKREEVVSILNETYLSLIQMLSSGLSRLR